MFNANFSLPKERVPFEMMKAASRELGLNPESMVINHAFTEPDTKYVNPQQRETEEIRQLTTAIKEELKGTIQNHQNRVDVHHIRNNRIQKMRIGYGAAGRDRTCDQRVTAILTLNSFSPFLGSAALTTELTSAVLMHTAASVLGGFWVTGVCL